MARDMARKNTPINEADASLTNRQDGVPPNFASVLFARAVEEDLAPYAPHTLAELAAAAWAHLAAPRRPGRHDVRLIDAQADIGGHRKDLTIVEVVNDNMPFLLDSTLAEIVGQGYEPLLVAHPILLVERDGDGAIAHFQGEATPETDPEARRESLIHIHLDRIDDEAARQSLLDGLDKVYADVECAVLDFAPMRRRLLEAIATFKTQKLPLPAQEVAEAIAFLEWIVADNFTILGARDYTFAGGDTAADPVEGSGLGIMRDPAMRVLRRGRELVVMTPEVRAFLEKPVALIITKANVKSRVHRRAHLDYIGVKLFNDAGQLTGELRVVGLFTSNAYTAPASAIPYLRHKVEQVVARAGFDPASYSGRALLHVLDTYPRDELFQVDIDTLYRFSLDILQLTERPRIRALARPDEFDRFVSILVYIPKDRYDTDVRRKVADFLARVYEGRVSAAYPSYPEGPLARTHFIIGRDEGRTPVVDAATLEEGITAIVRTWGDGLRAALTEQTGGEPGRRIAARYAEAFSAAYREAFDPAAALRDIAIVENLSEKRTRAVDFYRRAGDPETRANLKVFARGTPLPLSERVPLLENLGFRVVNERTYRVTPEGAAEAERVWLHDMALERTSGGAIDVAGLDPLIEAVMMALFAGEAESDKFNALVLEAELGWRDVAVIRAFGRYLRQVRIAYGQDYLAATLARYPAIARKLVDLFHARFDPALSGDRAARQADIRAQIEAALQEVTSLDDDRILRRFLNLIEATLRTNFFQLTPQGSLRATISFKIECAKVEELPLPRPLYEIFVYSPRVEGLHLRFGKVARGGLRWSDRPQDFRTEILGLVKAQQVKNAVIVPVGAKGGFVPKRLPPASDRAGWMAEGIESYKIFVGSLLDLTDNIVGDAIVPPERTVRHDGDDPYLVVAADKGTATFSDIANELSLQHQHWLGDAFASGGSQGYDHKKMGITARGAWEAVKRHFREIDIDIQTQPVTVAGVGDMSGDVFGNGMLLSPELKLVAAFDHRDIFLDPDPDPAKTFAERQRMFDLPRSSWQDYDKSLISKGGGIFPRSAKSIPLSPEVQALLGLAKASATPQEVMNAILKAPVDLLWFGGIGTYIRASDETDEQAGDRANDAIRVTGTQLRCKVIGEGANLGVTQRGRIEAARAGVRLNTDAIDNSAGVNTSDVEVNIKIALAQPERDGRLDEAARNVLLADMTDEVARLVLRNNYLQTLAISLTERRGVGETGFAVRLMRALEADGRLDRGVEYLPIDEELAARERRGEALTRPEIAVLLAYAKLALHDALLASPVPDDPYLATELERYFPAQVRERFPDAVQNHRLRREIIATQLANAIINRGGPTIVTRLVDQTGAEAPTIAAAYAAVRDVYGLVELNAAIDALDGQVPGKTQLGLYADMQDLLLGRLVWFIRNVDMSRGLDEIVALYAGGVGAVATGLENLLGENDRQAMTMRVGALTATGVPADLARRVAALPYLGDAPDIVLVAQRSRRPAVEVAAIHFAVGQTFRLGALAEAGRSLSVPDYYDRLALERAIDAIGAAHRKLTADIAASGGNGQAAVDAWTAQHGDVARIRGTVDGIVASGLTLSKLTVAASLLGDLARE